MRAENRIYSLLNRLFKLNDSILLLYNNLITTKAHYKNSPNKISLINNTLEKLKHAENLILRLDTDISIVQDILTSRLFDFDLANELESKLDKLEKSMEYLENYIKQLKEEI